MQAAFSPPTFLATAVHSSPTAVAATTTPFPRPLRPSTPHPATHTLPHHTAPPLLSTGGKGPPRANTRGRGRDDSPDEASGPSSWPLALLAHYNAHLRAAPLLTKSLSASVLALLSDLLAQALSPAPADLARLTRYFFYGLLVIGPQGHFWFAFLDAAIRRPGATSVLAKLALDQLAFAPIATALFFGVMSLAEGKGLRRAAGFVEENWGRAMRSSYRLWPAVNLVNFAVVPSQYRVVFTSSVSVFWIAFLSVVANRGEVAPCGEVES